MIINGLSSHSLRTLLMNARALSIDLPLEAYTATTSLSIAGQMYDLYHRLVHSYLKRELIL
ncbi:hypothetical protein HRbin01_00722 [archaeon HR01]|nr:hypothetical protein HRbin01_00722 [archaeon HR01]